MARPLFCFCTRRAGILEILALPPTAVFAIGPDLARAQVEVAAFKLVLEVVSFVLAPVAALQVTT